MESLEVEEGLFGPPLHDFSDRGMVDSLAAAIEHLQEWYTFTEYKQIDFNAIKQAVLPLAALAHQRQDHGIFAEACLTLVAAIPDGMAFA